MFLTSMILFPHTYLSLKSISISLVEDKTKLGHWTLHSLSLLANFFIITSLICLQKNKRFPWLSCAFPAPSVYSLIISGCLIRICSKTCGYYVRVPSHRVLPRVSQFSCPVQTVRTNSTLTPSPDWESFGRICSLLWGHGNGSMVFRVVISHSEDMRVCSEGDTCGSSLPPLPSVLQTRHPRFPCRIRAVDLQDTLRRTAVLRVCPLGISTY